MKNKVKITINETEDIILQDGKPLVCCRDPKGAFHGCSPRCPMNSYAHHNPVNGKDYIQFYCGYELIEQECEIKNEKI